MQQVATFDIAEQDKCNAFLATVSQAISRSLTVGFIFYDHGSYPDASTIEYIEFATYDELRKSLEALTHGIQLLGGKPAVEHRQRIDQLIED